MKVTGKGRGKLRFADREEGELTPGSGSSDSGQARGPPPVEPPRLGLGPGKLFPGVKGDPPVSGKFGKGRGRARARVDDAAPLGTKAVAGSTIPAGIPAGSAEVSGSDGGARSAEEKYVGSVHLVTTSGEEESGPRVVVMPGGEEEVVPHLLSRETLGPLMDRVEEFRRTVERCFWAREVTTGFDLVEKHLATLSPLLEDELGRSLRRVSRRHQVKEAKEYARALVRSANARIAGERSTLGRLERKVRRDWKMGRVDLDRAKVVFWKVGEKLQVLHNLRTDSFDPTS